MLTNQSSWPDSGQILCHDEYEISVVEVQKSLLWNIPRGKEQSFWSVKIKAQIWLMDVF